MTEPEGLHEPAPPSRAGRAEPEHGIGHIVQSLFVNGAIVVVKTGAAIFTGSGAMLAEAIHSLADCANQVLLLVGVRGARRPPDRTHPLGYGRDAYFWSFMVALLLFSLGGMFSIYEGVHKLSHPEPMEHTEIGVGILLFSLLLESGATISNVREIGRRRGAAGFFEYLRATKDSDLIVVFGENAADVVGLSLALAALVAAHVTGDPRWDAVGGIAIGVVLVAVAVFLSVEVKSLLVGERADERIESAVRSLADPRGEVREVLTVLTLQQGPGEVLVACKVRMASHLRADDVAESINAFERALHAKCPEVRWSFVEPDVRE